MPKTITAYIGLLRADGSEPPAESGYARSCVREVGILDAPGIPFNNDIVFNEVTVPGCGLIAAYGLFDCPKGGEPLYVWTMLEPVNVHEDTIPVIHNGKLLLGVDVSAKIQLQSADMCSVGGGG